MPKLRHIDFAWPMWRYPLGSGGNRVMTRPPCLPLAMSLSIIWRIKLVVTLRLGNFQMRAWSIENTSSIFSFLYSMTLNFWIDNQEAFLCGCCSVSGAFRSPRGDSFCHRLEKVIQQKTLRTWDQNGCVQQSFGGLLQEKFLQYLNRSRGASAPVDANWIIHRRLEK